MTPSAWMSWGSEKDSAYPLHEARLELGTDVPGLRVTVNADADRVAFTVSIPARCGSFMAALVFEANRVRH
jgi:hypothetical protein